MDAPRIDCSNLAERYEALSFFEAGKPSSQRDCYPVALQNLIRADSLVVSIEFRDGTATDMPAVLRNGRREAAILLLANHGRTREDWLFGANRAMCVVPGEVRAR